MVCVGGVVASDGYGGVFEKWAWIKSFDEEGILQERNLQLLKL